MTKPQDKLDTEDPLPASENTAHPDKPRARTLGWLLTAALALALLGAIGWGMTSAAVASFYGRPASDEFWAAFTGPVGDTFGPLLSTLAILVTVFVAVWWQPKQNLAALKAQQRHDQDVWEKQQEDAGLTAELNAAKDRASKVDGWIAETTDAKRLGVVVSNDADAVVSDLDIVVHQEKLDAFVEAGIDREFKLPRGIWFIEFTPGSDQSLSWRAPVPVREADGMEVSLEPFVTQLPLLDNLAEDTPAHVRHVLRPHVAQTVAGKPMPYFVLHELRYFLHGQAWIRDERGRPENANPLSEGEDQRREDAGKLLREEQRDRAASSRRVDGDLETLLRYTVDVLCRTQSPEVRDLYAAAIGTELPVDQQVLPGVVSLNRPTKGGRLRLRLATPAGVSLVVMKSGDYFPHSIWLEGPNERVELTFKDKKAFELAIKRAGASVIGTKNASGLTGRTPLDWLRSDAEKWKWITALSAMTSKAQLVQLDGSEQD